MILAGDIAGRSPKLAIGVRLAEAEAEAEASENV